MRIGEGRQKISDDDRDPFGCREVDGTSKDCICGAKEPIAVVPRRLFASPKEKGEISGMGLR